MVNRKIESFIVTLATYCTLPGPGPALHGGYHTILPVSIEPVGGGMESFPPCVEITKDYAVIR